MACNDIELVARNASFEIPGASAINGETAQETWHPKLTPYRLLVLSTTIGLGTAKAITAELGDNGASITLEWIAGVVVFLIVQGVSSYDGPGSTPPTSVSWMFTTDCMDYVWELLDVFSVPCPRYHSDEKLDARDLNRPPITLYRLLVCCAVVFFGLTKAALAYFGYSTAVNWIDWSLGVLVTTVLYCVGLYENNTLRRWEGFFVVDYSDPVDSASLVLLDVIVATISAAWINFWILTLRYFIWTDWHNPGAAPSIVSEVQTMSLKIMLTVLSIYAIVSGGVTLCVFLGKFANRSQLGGRLLSAISTAALAFLAGRQFSWSIALHIFIHAAVYLSGISFCIATALFQLGFTFGIIQEEGIVLSFISTIVALASGLLAAAAVVWAWTLAYRMMKPLYVYHSPRRSDWERALL